MYELWFVRPELLKKTTQLKKDVFFVKTGRAGTPSTNFGRFMIIFTFSIFARKQVRLFGSSKTHKVRVRFTRKVTDWFAEQISACNTNYPACGIQLG